MIILLLIIIYIYFFKSSKNEIKKNKNCYIKNIVYLKRLVKIRGVFFCSQNLEYEIANNITNNYIKLNNYAKAKNIIQILKNAGFNLSLPIYKLEFYTQDCSYKNYNINKYNHKNIIKINSLRNKNNINNIKKNNTNNVNNFNNIEVAKDNVYKSREVNFENNLNILQKIYKYLQAIKKLKNKDIFANYLIFIDDESLFKNITKLINYFNVNIKVYLKTEIEYSLLSAINSVNINKQIVQDGSTYSSLNYNKLLSRYQINFNKLDSNITKNFSSKTSSLNNNSSNQNDMLNKFYLHTKEHKFCFNNFVYSNYYLTSKIEDDSFFAHLSVTQNTVENALIFKLVLENKTCRNIALDFDFLFSIFQNKPLNAVYFIDSAKSHIYLSNIINSNMGVFLCGKFTNLQHINDAVYCKKTFNIQPKKSEEFYFLITNFTKNILEKICDAQNNTKIFSVKNYANYLLLSLKNLYENTIYNKLKLIKILTQNKTLNLLINEYLPQKIIKNYIINNFNFTFKYSNDINNSNQEFYNLKDNVFNIDMVSNEFNIQNLNTLFLFKNNLYKIYLNLIYFKIGLFPSLNGLNLNPNKAYIENEAVVSLKNFSNITININKINLKNEIIIDNIKYTNLNFLSLSNKTKNLHLQF